MPLLSTSALYTSKPNKVNSILARYSAYRPSCRGFSRPQIVSIHNYILTAIITSKGLIEQTAQMYDAEKHPAPRPLRGRPPHRPHPRRDFYERHRRGEHRGEAFNGGGGG